MADYQYRIEALQFKDGNTVFPGQINVFVGANNCGKTQILKDVLSYVTGQNKELIVLNKLEIPYPNNWEEFQCEYNMPIVNSNGNKQLRHVSPTFDKECTGPALSSETDLINYLNVQLQYDQRQFREATGSGLITYLNTDNRLKLAMRQPVQDLNSRGAANVLEALFLSGNDKTQTVRGIIKDIFNTDVYLDPSNLGMLQFRVGKDFSTVSDNILDANKQLIRYPLLDDQGDGIRSALGIICAIIAVEKPIILIDEPEAFLHPPQAMKLGSVISKLVNGKQQIFISTHSADFLRGLLSSTQDAVIVHLNRHFDNMTEVNALNSKTLENIITDPLLSSSRVLDGMFYKGVVATEGDADAVFYQRLFQKIGSSDEIHFVNAHNKQTLKKLIEPYKTLGIKFAMIADADVIRDMHEFKNIIDISSDDEIREKIINERDMIYNHFRSINKYDTLCALYDETRKLIEKELPEKNADSGVIDSAIFDFRKELKRLRNESDELADFKKRGIDSLPDDLKETYENLLVDCAQIGLFIVKVGELESWLVDYDIPRISNKSNWISEALSKLYDIIPDSNKEVWKFIRLLKEYLIS